MRSYYPLLDLLRFASALGVAFFHLMFWSWAGIFFGIGQTRQIFKDAAQFPFAVDFTWFGWVGVDVFFVISGFVIANSANKASPAEFLTSRALRLYPAAWVCSTATFTILLIFTDSTLADLFGPYIRSALLVPRGRWIDGAYWTLAVEISFYALVFILLIVKRITLLHLAWALTVYSAIFNIFTLLLTLKLIPSDTLLEFLIWHRMPLDMLLLNPGCLFALGIWLWVVANRKLDSLERFALSLAFLSGGIEVFVRAAEFIAVVPAASAQSPSIPIAVWTVAVCIVYVAAREGRRSNLALDADVSLLRTVGLVTYPFYLIHNVLGAGVTRLLIAAGCDAILALCLTIVSLLALSWAFCSMVEPIIKLLLKRFFSRLGLLPRSQAILF